MAADHFVGITPEVVERERGRRLDRGVPLRALLLEADGPRPSRGGRGSRRW